MDGPWIQGNEMVGLCNECGHAIVGLRAPAAFLNTGILTEKEAERKIRTPLLDRFDHGEARAGRCSLQQRVAKLHRILRHCGDETLYIGDREDSPNCGPRVVPFRHIGRHKPPCTASEGLQRRLKHHWVPRVVVEKLVGNCCITCDDEGAGERPHVKVEDIWELVHFLNA